MKPAIVLLHSSMSSKAQWAALSAELAAQYDCIALDLLGYGEAPFPHGATANGFDSNGGNGGNSGNAGAASYRHTLAHEADAVLAALDARLAPDTPFHLVGHAYGGASALHLARRLPARVLSLTLHEPVAFHLLPEDHAARVEIVAVVAAIAASATDRDATRRFIDYWNRPGAFDNAPPAAQDKMIAMIAKVRLDFDALLGEAAGVDDLAALTMPALVMAGQHSPASTRLLAERLAAALPNAAAATTRGGHMGPITHADAINPMIAAFLAGANTPKG